MKSYNDKFITAICNIFKKVIFKDVYGCWFNWYPRISWHYGFTSIKEEKVDENKFNSNDMILALAKEKEKRIICKCGNDEFKWFGLYVICPQCGNKMKKTGKKGKYKIWFCRFDLINRGYSSNWEKQYEHSPNQNTVTVAEDVRVVCN